MEITKREVLTSVSIVAVMLLIGFLISGKIQNSIMDNNERYNKAVKIENEELFRYGMNTNVGDAFVYGGLEAVDTVTFPEIGGEYMYVEKEEEHYNRHTRTYTTTDGKGHIKIHTEVSFCCVVFDSGKIKLPDADYIDTIKESSRVRYKYYGTGTRFKGTIFTELKDKTISDNTHFYQDRTIDKTVEHLESKEVFWQVLFWIFWIGLIGAVVCGFYYLDNKWLE